MREATTRPLPSSSAFCNLFTKNQIRAAPFSSSPSPVSCVPSPGSAVVRVRMLVGVAGEGRRKTRKDWRRCWEIPSLCQVIVCDSWWYSNLSCHPQSPSIVGLVATLSARKGEGREVRDDIKDTRLWMKLEECRNVCLMFMSPGVNYWDNQILLHITQIFSPHSSI